MTTDPRRSRGRLRALVAVAGLGAFTLVVAMLVGFLIGLHPVVVAALVVALVVGVLVLRAVLGRRSGGGTESGIGAVFVQYAVVGVVGLAVIQLVPYGRAHDNPPVTGEPEWSSPRTRELMVNACYGCHSNEVEWPWYSNIAPISWAISRHVDDGRHHVNYSEFATNPGEADETIEVILDGEMPPTYYTRFGLHPEANLSDAERAELIEGLRATPGLAGDGEHDEDD